MISIYAMKDPRTGEIRYIGQAIDPIRRHREHCYYGSPNRKMRMWIVELSTLGLLPEMLILETTLKAEANFREHYWIQCVKASGARLLNKIRVPGVPQTTD